MCPWPADSFSKYKTGEIPNTCTLSAEDESNRFVIYSLKLNRAMHFLFGISLVLYVNNVPFLHGRL